MISLLVYPFLACVLLVLIHVYFGVFVLRRGVIFIDLALAQWAALGYLVGHWLDIEHAVGLFCMSFGFTMIASLLLTVLKPLYSKVNLQEAVIGVMYILASTIAVAIVSSTGLEGHHLTDMLAGHLLFVQPEELILASSLYGGIVVLLLGLHKTFWLSSSGKWDFVFYILFGLVVTSSVKLVGLLLVFTFLVMPILSVVLYSNQFKHQLVFGWIIGILGSAIGLCAALWADIPPSFTVILVLGGIWLINSILHRVLKETSQ